jgi:hypothetical protein
LPFAAYRVGEALATGNDTAVDNRARTLVTSMFVIPTFLLWIHSSTGIVSLLEYLVRCSNISRFSGEIATRARHPAAFATPPAVVKRRPIC